MKDIRMVTKSTNTHYICKYDQSDPRVSTEGALQEAGRADQHIIEAAPNELKLGRGA